MKRIVKLLLIIALIVNVSVIKADVIDFTKKGEIDVNLTESINKEAVEGAEISITKLADVDEDSVTFKYKYIEEMEGCNVDLTNLESTDVIDELATCAYDRDLTSIVDKTDENGDVAFTDLDLGLYLVEQTNSVKGYSIIDPYLVVIPKVVENKWTYNVKTTPKTDIIRLEDLTVKKVWNNGLISRKTPDSVTIELLKDNEVIDTITLNEVNEWTYTWEDIEASDDYQVLEINIPEGYKANYKEEGTLFTVTNTNTLAQTGLEMWKVELLAILGIIFIAIGIAVKVKKHD